VKRTSTVAPVELMEREKRSEIPDDGVKTWYDVQEQQRGQSGCDGHVRTTDGTHREGRHWTSFLHA